jgi:contact-dependent growth inhibition (CDI) system CdiI-like immunity protein
VSTSPYSLKDFILAYFHPDWQLDSPSRAAVVEEFLRTAKRSQAQAVAKDLHELLERNLTEEQLHALVIDEYSLFFDPWRHEISMREWLEGLLGEVEAGVRNESPRAE